LDEDKESVIVRKAIIIPHYNTPNQFSKLLDKIPPEYHSDILVIDDGSKKPPLRWSGHLIRHEYRKGYGATQKTGYNWAILNDYDQVLLVHGDNQYSFRHILEASVSDLHISIGSRLMKDDNQMPVWRRKGNQLLTGLANTLFNQSHSDLHTGARIFSVPFLASVPYENFSDNFLFDQQMIAYCLGAGVNIEEFSIPSNYEQGVSSISFRNSVHYGLGCLWTLLDAKYRAE
jgi:hypothetical protein